MQVVRKKFTFKFQLIIACFPDTSESFNNISLGEILPRDIEFLEPVVDCAE